MVLNRLARLIVVLVACAISICLFFHRQIGSGLAFIFGDEFDAVIEAVLVSHWFHVLGFQQHWNEPLYFFPYKDVLGYNDGYFLYGIIASFFRMLGFNLFSAQALLDITMKALGFLSMFALMARLRPTALLINVLGAALFTLAINSSDQANHGQLLAIGFAPLLSVLLFEFVQSVLSGDRKRALAYGIGSGTLFGSMLLTAFYMSWFFGLFALTFVIVYAVLDRAIIGRFLRSLGRIPGTATLIFGWFTVMVAPFVFVYIPKLHQTAGRSYANQLQFSLRWSDVLSYSPNSLIWGGWLSRANDASSRAWAKEFQVGFTPDILLALALISIALFLSRSRSKYPSWLQAMALAILVSLALPVSVYGHSLWYFIHWIPGAAGVGTISRYYIFLSFPISILITYQLAGLSEWRTYGPPMAAFALLFLCASQINRDPPVQLNVGNEMALVVGVGAPPKDCSSFVVVNPVGSLKSYTDQLYRTNVQAMLVADEADLPTLNGMASFGPPDQPFLYDSDYLKRVRNYAAYHGLEGVCRYDISKKRWYATLGD